MQPINKAPERRSFDIALPLKIAVGFALALILVLTLAQVVLRYFFDSPLLWSEELSRLLVVWMTFIGAAAVCWQGRHLSVDVFVVLLPERVRKFVRLINQFLALGFLTILTWKSFRIVKLENFQEMSILPAACRNCPPGSHSRCHPYDHRDCFAHFPSAPASFQTARQ